MSEKNNNPMSPLRYPGSKRRVMKDKILKYIPLNHSEYREPFVGGASIFFNKPLANRNWINDKDPYIATLWQVVRDYPEELCKLIEKTTPTLDLWKKIQSQDYNSNSIEQAFKCLFLNRTNYSGILHANPIGGMSQSSDYKINCRWNTQLLIQRINHCSEKLQGVTISSQDFQDIITQNGVDVFMIIDPPYYHMGRQLYPVTMTPDDHQILSSLLRNTKHKFLLTIDDCPEVRQMYKWANFLFNESWTYTLNTSADNQTVGQELFITNYDLPHTPSTLINDSFKNQKTNKKLDLVSI